MEPNWACIVSTIENVERLGAEAVRLIATVPPKDDLVGRRNWCREYQSIFARYAKAADAAKLIMEGGF